MQIVCGRNATRVTNGLRSRCGACARLPSQAGYGENPKFYLYKMTVDDGGAPCVQNGLLTLAICKPAIRRAAPEGSVIIGFAGNCLRSESYDDNSIVYAAVVLKTLTGGEYYSNREYADRPDCIYKRTGKRFARKAKAIFHKREGHLEHDLGTPPDYGNAVALLSEDFRYFGNQCPVRYKKKFPRLKDEIERLAQGHRVNHAPELWGELVCLEKLLWKARSPFASTPIPSELDDRCDCEDDAVECGGC